MMWMLTPQWCQTPDVVADTGGDESENDDVPANENGDDD